jgi:hypothetical protein
MRTAWNGYIAYLRRFALLRVYVPQKERSPVKATKARAGVESQTTRMKTVITMNMNGNDERLL